MKTTASSVHRTTAAALAALGLALALGGCAATVDDDGNASGGPAQEIGRVESALSSDYASELDMNLNDDGRLEVFFIGSIDGYLYHRWENSSRVWTTTGTLLVSPAKQAKHLVSILDSAKHLEVFYIAMNDDIYRTVQASSGAWSAPERIGMSQNTAQRLAVAKNADGRLEVFYIGLSDNVLYHNYQMSNGTWSGQYLLDHNYTWAQALAVGTYSDGKLEVFYIGRQNVLYRNIQLTPNGDWSGEALLGTSSNKALKIAVANNGLPGYGAPLEVFYIGTDNALYHTWVTSGVWSGEHNLGIKYAKSVVASTHPTPFGFSIYLDVMYCGATDSVVYYFLQTQASASSGALQYLGNASNKCDQVVARSRFGETLVVYIGTDGRLYKNTTTSPGSAETLL